MFFDERIFQQQRFCFSIRHCDFNAGDLDSAPDGNIYHSNSSFALFRLDPVTGVQTNVGFGSVGALAGVVSFVPLPAAMWMMLGGLLALWRVAARIAP